MQQTVSSRLRPMAYALAFAAALLFALVFAGQAHALDADNLPAGTYTAKVSMVHTVKYAEPEPSCYSMSNEAVKGHTVTITSDGKGNYTAAVEMQGITINFLGQDNFGYMANLRYLDGGEFKETTVDKYYDVVDDYNKDTGVKYPQKLHFPLVNKAKGDLSVGSWGGVVSMQVFVPIMEAISPGVGTQSVYMKIHWDTLAPTVTSGGVTYTVSGKTAKVTAIASSAKSATIKPTVKFGGKTYKVTAVGAKAATGAKKLASVTIGKNVTAIGVQAFKGCGKLKTVTFRGKSVKSIGKQAFKGIAKKATFKAPAGKRGAYKKLVKKAGAPAGFKMK